MVVHGHPRSRVVGENQLLHVIQHPLLQREQNADSQDDIELLDHDGWQRTFPGIGKDLSSVSAVMSSLSWLMMCSTVCVRRAATRSFM